MRDKNVSDKEREAVRRLRLAHEALAFAYAVWVYACEEYGRSIQ